MSATPVAPAAVPVRKRRKQSKRARAQRRRAQRIADSGTDLTTDQWAGLVGAWGGCAYCGARGVPLQKDCVMPISRGGRYTLANVVPACRSCNTSKCNAEVTTWMRRKGLDERGFLARRLEIDTGSP